MRLVVVLMAALAPACEMSAEQCAIDQVCATPGERFGVGGGADRVALRDLDGDGEAEWISVSARLGTLRIVWGDSGAAQTWSLGQEPADLAIADVDGDGRLDVVAPLRAEGALALLRGAGPGRLAEVERVPVGPRPQAVAAADLDADGRAEVVVADAKTGDLRVVRAGPEGLVAGAPVAAGAGPRAVVAGEFSGDGRVDVAVTLAGEGVAKLFLGTGDGGLRAGATLYTGAAPAGALAADVDGDGALDLALVDDLLDEAAVVLGDGAGGARETRRWSVAAGPRELALREGPNGHELLVLSFAQRALTQVPLAAPERRITTIGSGWDSVAAGDVDGDGAAEVLLGASRSGTSVQRDRPGFGFEPWFEASGPGLAGPLAAKDLDRDGWLDLVVSDEVSGELALLRGQPGGFAAPVRSPGPTRAAGLLLADVDGDGADDVVAWKNAGIGRDGEVVGGRLWSARVVGDRFASPVEFQFGGDPRRVIAFDSAGDGRRELLVLQHSPYLPFGSELPEEAGPGLLTLQRVDDALTLVDRTMSPEFAAVGDVLAGEFSAEHAGDELIWIGPGPDGPSVRVESRSARTSWTAGTLSSGRTLGLTRADFDGDGIADLLVCSDGGLILAPGRSWRAFEPGRRITSSRCDDVVVGELDGDGRPDVVATASPEWEPAAVVQLGHALPWLSQLHLGGLTTASNRPRALALADFDGDGLPDLAASGIDGLQVLRGGPRAVLLADHELSQTSALVGGLELGDLDGDGRDEVVAFGRARDLGIGWFDETGTLGPVRYDMSEHAFEPPAGAMSEWRLLLDVDGDGADELLWTRQWRDLSLGVSELWQLRGGRLVPQAGVPFPLDTHAAPATGDIDGDGDDDLVYLHTHGALVTHAGGPEGLGPARFGPQAASDASEVQLGDVDRDGRLDAIVPLQGDEVHVHRGDGRGGFSAEPQAWPMDWTARPLIAGDLDDDGSGDLIAGLRYTSLAVLRVCHGAPSGPPRACRQLRLDPGDAELLGFAVEDVDGDGVSDVLAVLARDDGRLLVFGRGGEGGMRLHVKPLPGSDPRLDEVPGVVRRARLDDAGPEWVFVNGQEVTRLGVRALSPGGR